MVLFRNIIQVLTAVMTTAVMCLGQRVSPTGSLQERIDNARVGDTIVVSQGMYEGNLLLSKRITLLGEGYPVVRGSGKGSVIAITADSCVLAGFVVEHCGAMLVEEDAGILLKSNGNVIENNQLRDILFGIYLYRSHRNVLRNNRIVGREELATGERGGGIHLWDSHYNRIIGNTVSHERDGLYIQNASHTWIESNEVFALRYGLHYMYADSNTFLRNVFHDNTAGAAIMYSRGIVMKHNVFTHNRGFASYGILFQDCHGMVADSNIVADNVIGMFFESSTNNRLSHNIIAQNDIALEMFANSTNNLFTENNFVDNLSPLTLIGKKTETRWGDRGRGNYWSSYSGYDLDNDGIGDVPMKIQNVFTYLEGRQPNLRLYLYSPASQALAMAAEAFPIVAINSELDAAPLMKPVDLGALVVNMNAGVKKPTSPDHHQALLIGAPLAALITLGLSMMRRVFRRVG
jgi:nitrous oxidase accessory protein